MMEGSTRGRCGQGGTGSRPAALEAGDPLPFYRIIVFAWSLLGSLAMGAVSTLGCSHAANPPQGGEDANYSVPVTTPGATDPCSPPAEGCACTNLGGKAPCEARRLQAGSFVYCGGERTCDRQTGKWGPCISTLNVSDGGAQH